LGLLPTHLGATWTSRVADVDCGPRLKFKHERRPRPVKKVTVSMRGEWRRSTAIWPDKNNNTPVVGAERKRGLIRHGVAAMR
jgi:hypothetical protein